MQTEKNPRTIADQNSKNQFFDYLETTHNEGDGVADTTKQTYWNQIKSLPAIDVYHDDRDQLMDTFMDNIESNSQEHALKAYLSYQYLHYKNSVDWDSNEQREFRRKYKKVLSDANIMKIERQDNKTRDMQTLTEEDHFIEKGNLLRFLRAVEPRMARFYTVAYMGMLRFSDLKLLKPDHLRHPDAIGVGDYGGIRIEKNRSKSKNSRTVEFQSELPFQILKEEQERTGTISMKGEEWDDVFFPDMKKHKINYQLGKRQNGKLYGTFPDLTGERRTIHSLRHTRITDLVRNGFSVEKVQEWAGHQQTSTTNHYTQFEVEDPEMLESFCGRGDINLREVIDHEP